MRVSSTWLLAAAAPALFVVACAVAPTGTEGGDDTASDPPPPRADAGAQLDEVDASVADASDASTCKTAPPNDRCGLAPQCGCEMNETCDITQSATGATSCVTAGSATLGRPCTATGDCLAGLTCMYGACRPYCGAARTTCTAAGTDLCVEVDDDSGKPEPNATYCTITCDPRQPAQVCGSNTCLWFPTYYSPEKVSDCNFAGTIAAGGACTIDSDCLPAMACMPNPNASNALQCQKWCRIGVAADCTSPQTCKDVFTTNAPVIDGAKEGLCQK